VEEEFEGTAKCPLHLTPHQEVSPRKVPLGSLVAALSTRKWPFVPPRRRRRRASESSATLLPTQKVKDALCTYSSICLTYSDLNTFPRSARVQSGKKEEVFPRLRELTSAEMFRHFPFPVSDWQQN